MFAEDRIPACRCTAHPLHEDRRKYMFVVREEPEYVVWGCQRCSEISHVPTVQVRVLPRGKERARYTLGVGKARFPVNDPRLAAMRRAAAQLRTEGDR